MTNAEEIKAQLTKVRQEMAKLLELLDAVTLPGSKTTPPAKKTPAKQ